MVSYRLDHLVQPDDQNVSGPIQDDEALLLFALIRCMRLRRVLELGGLSGYSARNFLRAVGPDGLVWTVDVNPVPALAPNHLPIRRDCRAVTAEDFSGQPLDLVFYDCHVYDAQMTMNANLQRDGIIDERTVIALHDTNLHPSQMVPWAHRVDGGWMHQAVERRMVNTFRNDGYEALMLHTRPDRHDASMPARHGLTILTRNRYLPVA